MKRGGRKFSRRESDVGKSPVGRREHAGPVRVLVFTLPEMGCPCRALSNGQVDQVCVLRRTPSYLTD